MNQGHSAPNSKGKDDAPQKAPNVSSSSAVKGAEHNPPYTGQSDSATKRHSYEKPAHWTSYVEALCAMALVLITGAYTYYAGQQLGTMRDQIGLAKKQLQVSERPWVSIAAKVALTLVLSEQTPGHITLLFTLHNSGQTPALNAAFAAFPHPLQNPADGEREADKVCQMFMPKVIKPAAFQATIFPGNDGYDSEDVDLPPTLTVADERSGPRFYVAGCVAYRSSLDSDWKYTEYIAAIEHGDKQGRSVPLPMNGTISAKSVRLNSIYFPQKAR